MLKRMVLTGMVMVTFLGGIGFLKFRQVQAAIAMATSYQPPPEAVTTTVARRVAWQRRLGAIGTVAAVKGVTLGADLPGVVEAIAFNSGDRVREGDVLVRLDTKQEEAQLAAAKARRELARLNLERVRGLRDKGVSSQAEFDTAVAESAQAEASVGEILATIDRKTLRAPFPGILGIREVDLGEYLTSGHPVVPLQSLDPIYVNFNLPQQDLSRVSVGSAVRVAADGRPETGRTGRVTAIDSVVDESTRNVKVQATFANPDLKLRPGMFVNAEVELAAGEPVIPIPASAIRYAPYGDSVFVVEALKGSDGHSFRGVRQQFVKLGSARGDQIAVLSGIKEGEEIVTSGAFKLRNGAAVLVNNTVQPGNDPAPKPEEN